MLQRFIPVILFSLSDASLARADTVQLKDKAAITGKILARKHDQVIMDIGYTVLTIPRNQIEKIMEGDVPQRVDRKTPPAANEDREAKDAVKSCVRVIANIQDPSIGANTSP